MLWNGRRVLARVGVESGLLSLAFFHFSSPKGENRRSGKALGSGRGGEQLMLPGAWRAPASGRPCRLSGLLGVGPGAVGGTCKLKRLRRGKARDRDHHRRPAVNSPSGAVANPTHHSRSQCLALSHAYSVTLCFGERDTLAKGDRIQWTFGTFSWPFSCQKVILSYKR